jgi:hypothetical protein
VSLSVVQIADKLEARGVKAGADLELWIPEALFRVAAANADAPEFEKELTAQTVTSGVLTLTDTTVNFAKIKRILVNATPALEAPSVDALRATLPSDVYWWAIEGSSSTQGKITVKNTDSSLTTLTSSSNVTVIGAVTPALSALPVRFEPALIDELVRIAGGAA